MDTHKKAAPHISFSHLIWPGLFFVVVYWLIESFAHWYWFEGEQILGHIFQPDIHELWMRIIPTMLLIIFSFYGQRMINQRKRVEQALIRSEREAHRILENNPAGIILVDCETRKIAYVNQNAVKMIGAPSETVLERQCHRYLCPSEKGQCPVLDKGQTIDISERKLYTARKKSVPVLKSVTKVEYQGRPHLLEAFFDITEQKKMQHAIHQAHTELNQIFQTATVGMRLIDRNFNILKANESFSRLSGIPNENVIGKKCFEVFAGDLCHTADCPLQQVLNGRKVKTDCEVSKTCSNGTDITCSLTVSAFEGSDGIIGIVEAFKDITELKRVQEAIKSERDRLHRILFHQFENVGIVNGQYLLEYQNEMLKQRSRNRTAYRCHEILRNRTEPCDDCLLQRALSSGTIQRFEFDDDDTGRSFQHTYTPFEDSNGQMKAVVSQLDVTERKASAAAALRSGQLAALGELAAGVAHEINNPVNGIINYAQILVNKTGREDAMHQIPRKIIHEGNRIAAIVASLLSFARQETEYAHPVSVRSILEEALTLTGAQLKKDGIGIVIDMQHEHTSIYAKPQELQQVFMNIISNSRYALNEKYPTGGNQKQIHIDVSETKNGDNGNDMVRICFTDYGVGIEPDKLEKIFHPFFTTKPTGKGTGLGLSISRKIIETHGGKLSISSHPDKGTAAIVELPADFP